MRRFKQLSRADRLKIEALLKAGHGKQEIADQIGVHVSTIYRELQRGRYQHTNSDLTVEDRYSPDIAEDKYQQNLRDKGPDLKIGKDHRLAEYIEEKIAEDTLREQSSEKLKLRGWSLKRRSASRPCTVTSTRESSSRLQIRNSR